MAKRNSRFTRVGATVTRRAYRVRISGFEVPICGSDFYNFYRAGVLVMVKETDSHSIAKISVRHSAFVDQVVGKLHARAKDRSYVSRAVADALSSLLGRLIKQYGQAA